MAKSLTGFLSQNVKKAENQTFAASERMLDDKGKPELWEISPIDAGENLKLRKNCMRSVPVPGRKGQFTQEFDTLLYQTKLAARCTVWPTLDDAELQSSYGVMGAEALIAKMLTPGEFEDYTAKILEINGFTDTGELVDEVKN
jgi:hypothetical protein